MPTYNGWNVVTMPTSPSARSIDFTTNQIVALSASPFTGQQQVQDWQAGWMEAQISLPPLTATQAAAWVSFLVACRGQASVFQLPTFLAAFVPAGAVPGGYWRLKTNSNKFSIGEAILYGFSFEIREAI